MSVDAPRFLPERLRPPVVGHRSRRGFVLLSMVPMMLLVLPRWRVEEVRVDDYLRLPAAAVHSLRELVGQPALGLDLEAIRDRVDVWPGVGEVQVELELPATIVVRVGAVQPRGCVRVGRNWHGVDADGRFAGVIEAAVPPLLEGFVGEADRGRGLVTADRIEKAAGGRVTGIRRITPADYRVLLVPAGGDEAVVIHVRPQGSTSEAAWCAALSAGSASQTWADLRRPDRMVLGRLSHQVPSRGRRGAVPSGVINPRGAESYSTVRRAPRGEKAPLGRVHSRPQQEAGEMSGLGGGP